jgi:hypothetical protein
VHPRAFKKLALAVVLDLGFGQRIEIGKISAMTGAS